MIEFYQAYADYRDMMDHTENMLRYLAKTVLGTTMYSTVIQFTILPNPLPASAW